VKGTFPFAKMGRLQALQGDEGVQENGSRRCETGAIEKLRHERPTDKQRALLVS
jgi:hypothetical protein